MLILAVRHGILKLFVKIKIKVSGFYYSMRKRKQLITKRIKIALIKKSLEWTMKA